MKRKLEGLYETLLDKTVKVYLNFHYPIKHLYRKHILRKTPEQLKILRYADYITEQAKRKGFMKDLGENYYCGDIDITVLSEHNRNNTRLDKDTL